MQLFENLKARIPRVLLHDLKWGTKTTQAKKVHSDECFSHFENGWNKSEYKLTYCSYQHTN